MSDLEDTSKWTTSDSCSDENPSATAERVDAISAKMTLSIADLLPDRKTLLKILAAGLLLVIGVVVWIFISHDEVPDPCKMLLRNGGISKHQLLRCQNRSKELVEDAVFAPRKINHRKPRRNAKQLDNNVVFSIVIDAGSTWSRIYVHAVRKNDKTRDSLQNDALCASMSMCS